MPVAPPPERLLLATLAALAALLVVNAALRYAPLPIAAAGASPRVSWAEVAGVLLAMALGGAIARDRRFRWIALAIVAATGALTVALAYLVPAPDGMPPLTTVLRDVAPGVGLGLLAAGLGAWTGERLGPRLSRA